ncbi:ABC transporter substrate-binding protein [Lysinimonas soli]|uniref:ABC transporter substrate-binding protein n=1 Tax=Lysinimonas soli TaxID=1074233 RepID=A0ABW0NJR7_9MICO
MTLRTRMRVVLPLIALAASAALLAGCSGASPSSGSTGTQTVKWWAWNAFNPDKTVKDFEAANPNIKIDYKQYSYDDYVTAARTGLTSSSGPDVFQVQPGDLVTNLGPLAVPLDSYLAKNGGTKNINPEGLSQLKLNGKQVALPAYMSAAGLIYYNDTILKQLNVAVPKDFGEWKTACATIEAAGYECLAHGAKDAWVNTDVYLSLINSIDPGAVYKAIAGKAKWTDHAFVQAMQSWKDLFTSGIIPAGATAQAEYPDAFGAFLEKKAAFIALGTWNTPGTMTATGIAVSQKTVTTKIDSVYLSAPFPAPVAGDKPTGLFGGPDNGWAVSAKSDARDASLKFLNFLSLGDGQKIQASGGNIPAVLNVAVSTSDVVDKSQVADIERQQADLKKLIGERQIPYGDLATALGDALSAVAAGTSTPADAMAQVEAVSAPLSR